MSGPAQSNLEQVFADVASNYRGADIDLHAVYREMREKSPVLPENFMARLGCRRLPGSIRIARSSPCSSTTTSWR